MQVWDNTAPSLLKMSHTIHFEEPGKPLIKHLFFHGIGTLSASSSISARFSCWYKKISNMVNEFIVVSTSAPSSKWVSNIRNTSNSAIKFRKSLSNIFLFNPPMLSETKFKKWKTRSVSTIAVGTLGAGLICSTSGTKKILDARWGAAVFVPGLAFLFLFRFPSPISSSIRTIFVSIPHSLCKSWYSRNFQTTMSLSHLNFLTGVFLFHSDLI